MIADRYTKLLDPVYKYKKAIKVVWKQWLNEERRIASITGLIMIYSPWIWMEQT